MSALENRTMRARRVQPTQLVMCCLVCSLCHVLINDIINYKQKIVESGKHESTLLHRNTLSKTKYKSI